MSEPLSFRGKLREMVVHALVAAGIGGVFGYGGSMLHQSRHVSEVTPVVIVHDAAQTPGVNLSPQTRKMLEDAAASAAEAGEVDVATELLLIVGKRLRPSPTGEQKETQNRSDSVHR